MHTLCVRFHGNNHKRKGFFAALEHVHLNWAVQNLDENMCNGVRRDKIHIDNFGKVLFWCDDFCNSVRVDKSRDRTMDNLKKNIIDLLLIHAHQDRTISFAYRVFSIQDPNEEKHILCSYTDQTSRKSSTRAFLPYRTHVEIHNHRLNQLLSNI